MDQTLVIVDAGGNELSCYIVDVNGSRRIETIEGGGGSRREKSDQIRDMIDASREAGSSCIVKQFLMYQNDGLKRVDLSKVGRVMYI